jgi:hypothetical protein
MDGSDAEESWFQKPMRLEAPVYRMPLIELPAGGAQSLKWMIKLDSASLQGEKHHLSHGTVTLHVELTLPKPGMLSTSISSSKLNQVHRAA